SRCQPNGPPPAGRLGLLRDCVPKVFGHLDRVIHDRAASPGTFIHCRRSHRSEVFASLNDHGPDTQLGFETIASQTACWSFRKTADENSPDTRLGVSLRK